MAWNLLTVSPNHVWYLENGIKTFTTVELINKYPGTYTTNVTLTDSTGKSYTGTVTVHRGQNKLEQVDVVDPDSGIKAYFAGEALTHWKVSASELINKDNGKQAKAFLDALDIGKAICLHK